VKQSRLINPQANVRADKAILIVLMAVVLSFGVSFSRVSQALSWDAVLQAVAQVGQTIISEFSKNFTELFSEMQDDTNKIIQSNALASDSLIQNQVDIFNAKIAASSAPPPQRCMTENINSAIDAVDKNYLLLTSRLNDDFLRRHREGESRGVALAKADVKNHEELYANFDGPDMLLPNPRNPFGNAGSGTDNKNRRAAVLAYVNRIVNPVPLPPVPKSQEKTNKGILYKKARLDYLAPLQLAQNSFATAMALNDGQSGLLDAMKKDLEAEDDYTDKLLKDSNGQALKTASKNTLMFFETRRRMSGYWQKELGKKVDAAVIREVANILAMQNYMSYENYKSRQRSELILSALLANKLKTSDERQRLLALYRELN